MTQGVVSAWMRRDATTNGDFDIYLYGSGTLGAVAGLGRNGFFHYCFYVLVTVLLRSVGGMGWVWEVTGETLPGVG